MTDDFLEQFARDVDAGLSADPKSLSSKYFYDEKGDQLFVQIMNMPEYYLTDCEFEIFSEQTQSLISAFGVNGDYFDLYELGAGDGTKTMQLLKGLENHDFTYKPIDISPFAIENLTNRVNRELPNINVEGKQGEYFSVLKSLRNENQKVILFMGSNIGNMRDELANDFLRQLSAVMNPGDKLLMGVDLKKSDEIVLPAYNDAQGYTREFNLNLLDRINRELGADFDRAKFDHKPQYDSETGLAESYLMSLENQQVKIAKTGKAYDFMEGEKIFMEVSRKYDDETIEAIADQTDLEIKARFFDSRHYFSDVIFEKQ